MYRNMVVCTAEIKNAIASLDGQVTDMQAGIFFFKKLAVEKGNSVAHEWFVFIKIKDTGQTGTVRPNQELV